MKKRGFVVVLEVYNRSQGVWIPHWLPTVHHCAETALRRAHRVVSRHEVTETREGRRAMRAYASVVDTRDRTKAVEVHSVEGPVRLVPSVGELGWTP